MKQLRSLHLYLGCFFAPMLLFFAVSGFWQTYDRNYAWHSRILGMLSTIHTSGAMKIGTLSNSILRDFVLVMSLGFITTTILGIIMAVKHGGSRKAAYCCLAFGVLFPLAVILIPVLLRGHPRPHAAITDFPPPDRSPAIAFREAAGYWAVSQSARPLR